VSKHKVQYLVKNLGVPNSNEWMGITPSPFSIGDTPLEKLRLICKVHHTLMVYLVLYHA
jgi:hypothetical protein